MRGRNCSPPCVPHEIKLAQYSQSANNKKNAIVHQHFTEHHNHIDLNDNWSRDNLCETSADIIPGIPYDINHNAIRPTRPTQRVPLLNWLKNSSDGPRYSNLALVFRSTLAWAMPLFSSKVCAITSRRAFCFSTSINRSFFRNISA